MSLPRLQINFVQRRRRSDAFSWCALGLGILGVATLAWSYERLAAEQEGLDLRLAQLASTQSATERRVITDSQLLADIRSVAAELATPWSRVLDELENASRESDGSVAVLSVGPDRSHGRLTVVAEARNLVSALNYVRILQRCQVISHPLLESHEVRPDVAERPVRVQISADWRVST